MTRRRGFLAGLGALLGCVAFRRWPDTAEASTRERGVWRGAGDPAAAATVLIVDGYLLAQCVAFNAEMQAADVDVADPRPGASPALMLCDNECATQRLYLGSALEIHTDGAGYPNKGFRYWTGDGWVNKRSERISGPQPVVLTPLTVGAALAPGQSAQVRNGRVYRA